MLFADRSISRRLERADAMRGVEYARALQRLSPDSGARILEVAGGYAIDTGSRSPLSKGIAIGMEGPVGDEDVKGLEEFYHHRGMPVQLDLSPLADPSLLPRLTARGYRPVSMLNVLAGEVDMIGPPSSSSEREGVEVRPAVESEGEIWAGLVGRGFLEGEEPPAEDLDLFLTIFSMSTAHCFIASAEGVIAGGGMVALSEGVALFGATSVLPEYRGRGIHTALIRARLALAAAHGCDLAMMVAHPGSPSQRNIERFGFQVMYTRVGMELGG